MARKLSPALVCLCDWLHAQTLALLAASSLLTITAAFAANSEFQSERIEGWPVFIDEEMASRSPELTERIRSEIRDKLHRITTLLPGRRVEELRRVPIYVWIGRGQKHGSGAYYSTGGGFGEGGVASGAVGGVAIDDPASALAWLRNVPSGLLHELTHAYHDQILGRDDPAILAAYQNAVDRHLYENVSRYSGQMVARSYALTNKAEYFALLTQAFYWQSGYYPFTNDQLKTYDPLGYETVRAAWEDRPGPQPYEKLSLTGDGRSCTHIKPKSLASPKTNAVISIHNWTGSSLSFFWIRSDGQRVAYRDILPGGYRSQLTRANQTWEIDVKGACLATVTIDGLGNHLDIVS